MQALGLEYLRFEDGRLEAERERERLEYQAKLLTTLVKAGLAATGEYQEKVLFQDYFPDEEAPEGSGGDQDVDFDYSEVEFATPDMDELALLESLLGDDSVTVSGAPLEGPDAIQVDRPPEDEGPDVPLAYALEPPKEFALPEPDPDAEWT